MVGSRSHAAGGAESPHQLGSTETDGLGEPIERPEQSHVGGDQSLGLSDRIGGQLVGVGRAQAGGLAEDGFDQMRRCAPVAVIEGDLDLILPVQDQRQLMPGMTVAVRLDQADRGNDLVGADC
ncbi:hypothetical protein LBMAG53_00170 [Planctomycetota bacterium]|nr:hypothetical protein LBMAG53_00170 [Planctomycetota bacterium]